MQISVWLSDNIGIGFFYDQRTPSDGDYVIQFADRAVSVVPYVTSKAYDQQITLVAAVLALAAALLIIAPYARRISSCLLYTSPSPRTTPPATSSTLSRLRPRT